MNEKIKELAEQAMWHTNSQTGEVYKTHFQFEERFAELIIKECVDIILEDKRINWDDSANLIYSIKDNFGIE